MTSNDANQQQQLKDEIIYFKNRLNILEKKKLNEMLKYEDRIRDLEESIDSLKNEQRKEVDRLESNYSKNINDLEAQISKQRERTIKLINEKDAEVERFKTQNISNSESASLRSIQKA